MTGALVNAQPMRTPLPPWYRRHLRRIAGALIAAAIVLAIGQFLVLPWLLHRRIVAALDEAGVKGVQFHVARATLWGSALSRAVAGENGALKIDRIDLDYAPSDLWNGRLKTIRISSTTTT